MDVRFYPFTRNSIYIQQMYILEKGYLKFKGYYHEKEENLPKEQLMFVNKDMYLIRVDSKTQSEPDLSGSFYDEDVGANICLFPSYIVEIHFTILLKNPSKDKFTEILCDMKEDDKICDDRESDRWDAEHAARSKDESKAIEVDNIVASES
jgi:hypothetical protein